MSQSFLLSATFCTCRIVYILLKSTGVAAIREHLCQFWLREPLLAKGE